MGDSQKHFGKGQKSVEPDSDGTAGPGRHVQQARRLQQLAYQAEPADFVARFGIDAEGMRPADPTNKASSLSGLLIGPSAIEGDGLHTSEPISAGTKLCDVVLDGNQPLPLSKMNRTDAPNAP